MKATTVNMRGGWIQVVDAETGNPVGAFNIPRSGRPGAFARRVVAKMAKDGYAVRTCDSMAGPGIPAILIGD